MSYRVVTAHTRPTPTSSPTHRSAATTLTLRTFWDYEGKWYHGGRVELLSFGVSDGSSIVVSITGVSHPNSVDFRGQKSVCMVVVRLSF